jgi:hypothetical protein
MADTARCYNILVFGDRGQFELSVVTAVPPNDECRDASGPLPLDGTVVLGSTVLATPESGNMEPCGPDSLTPGVWFYIRESTGHPYIASTDFNSTAIDAAAITVYTGSFANLLCADVSTMKMELHS